MTVPPQLQLLAQALPLDNAVRLDLHEGVPIFRAPDRVRDRVEDILEKQQTDALSAEEQQELRKYEELDDFLSLVNRLVRNSMLESGGEAAHVSAA